jgi:superfamily II DNA/RNA helicase
MRSEVIASIRARIEELLATGRFQNYVAQCHSRDVLRSMRTPEADWPQYTANLDEDLVYTAQYLLYVGMNLKPLADTLHQGNDCLTLGAEILDHVYSGAVGSEDPERVTQLFSAALAYYMAGHFARAFVLVRDLEASRSLPRFVRPLRHFLLKDFRRLRSFVLTSLFRDEYSDESLSARVASGEIGECEAICLVFEATLFRALSHFLEHMKSGDEPLLDAAETLLDDAIELAIDQRFADWWWYCSCVKAMLSTYRDHSLWANLKPLLTGISTEPIAEGYIRANFRLQVPVVELWPSQRTAIPYLFSDESPKSLCLRMPTSAGKTKIAELAILRFLTDFEEDPNAKCVYVAPFRALAVEVEQTLKDVFSPLGIRVSELYGGFELSVADRVLIERTHILVATPEKLDALFRFSPDLVASLKLVIFDEGHIISDPDFKSIRSSRGLKYEVFLQRTVRRLETQGTRIVFLSAVMPNAEQFAEWITGDPSGLVSSNWRPSRLMLGEAVWDGRSVAIEYTHADYKPLGHRCFVRSFVTQVTAEAFPNRRRRSPFPRDGAEALALSAIEFAGHGMTMVFVARKASAEPFGHVILGCIHRKHALATVTGGAFSLPADERCREDVDRCLQLIEEHMGSGATVGECLKAGVVVHHGSLPQAVRLGLERLVRKGAVRLVVATTTLAQGVNFPIRTVLVHSLDHGKGEIVSPMDFWNICGRAGRGMKENEGQVLFFVNDSFPEWVASKPPKFRRQSEGWQRRIWNESRDEKKKIRGRYIAEYGHYTVNSALIGLVRKVFSLWKVTHPTVRVAELCEALANHRLDLFGTEDGVDLESLLSTFDGLALALTEGCEAEQITPELFDDLLGRSLAFLQLETDGQRRNLTRVFAARLQYVYARHPDSSKRQHFYRLGLPLRDCERVDGAKDQLLALFLQASAFHEWDVGRRADLLGEIAEILFQLDEIKPSGEIPDCWKRLLALWLSGQTPTEIARDPEVAECEMTTHAVSRWIDDVCGYRLPWGYNMLSIHLKKVAEDSEREIPSVCDSFSSLVKYGVHEPVACWLLTFGVQSRRAALRTAALVGAGITDPKALLEWLRDNGLKQLGARGLEEESLREIEEAVGSFNNTGGGTRRPATTVYLPYNGATAILEPGTRLLLQRGKSETNRTFRVLSLGGKVVGSYKLTTPDETLWGYLRLPSF